MHNKKLVRKILPFAIISAIGIFGLVSTTSLIAKARNSSDFDVIQASVAQHLPEDAKIVRVASNSHGSELESDDTKSSKNEHLTIIGTSKHFWIFQYVFDKLEYDYKSPNNMISKKTLENIKDGSEKVLMIADENMRKIVSGEELPRTSKAE